MGFLGRTESLKTAMDIVNAARELAQTVDAIKVANRELVDWVNANAQEVPLELQQKIIQLSNAIHKF